MSTQLVDSFGRVHRDLRVSLTDRCSLRCTYCMPADFDAWIPNDQLLSRAEIVEVIAIAAEQGITQVRLTGGEPLLRPDIVEIVADINALPTKLEISVTTNGILLQKYASGLKDAGLKRINVSLDTLNREVFKKMTYRDRLNEVFEGLAAAKSAGLSPIKINSVLMRGINDHEAPDLLDWALKEGYWLRFIEQMPLDAGHTWKRDSLVTSEEIMASLSTRFSLSPVEGRGSEPAEEFYVNGGLETVGVIASVTKPFCANCDRLRLTSDGQLRSCLFAREEMNLRNILRDENLSPSERRSIITSRFEETVRNKLPGHQINQPDFVQPIRPMSAIGG